MEGFFKGVGKGLLGLFTKPAGGTVDMVSLALDGIRRFVTHWALINIHETLLP